MEKPVVKIVHSLPNRVRVKLSEPLKDNKVFCKMVREGAEHTKIRYNNIINTVVVSFDPSEVLLKEMIYKISTAYSVVNGMVGIKLVEEKHAQPVNHLGIYSGSMILLSSLHKLLNKTAVDTQEFFTWFSMGITTLAITEHAYVEVKKKGVFDIEIIPAFYFIRNFINNPSTSVVGLMWLTTFGRHIFVNYQGVKEVKVLRVKKPKEESYYYIANIKEHSEVGNLSELIHHVFPRGNKPKANQEEKYIMTV